METVYEAAGGADGLLRLAGAWHARVMADEVVSHAFSHGFHPEHTERLAAYWAEALGGPMTFSTEYGDETSVVRMHSGNGPHDEMDRRAIACFDQALADVGLADDEQLQQVLHDYFAWATTTTMSRYHRSADDVPDSLTIPHWSWVGMVATPFTSCEDLAGLKARGGDSKADGPVSPLPGYSCTRALAQTKVVEVSETHSSGLARPLHNAHNVAGLEELRSGKC